MRRLTFADLARYAHAGTAVSHSAVEAVNVCGLVQSRQTAPVVVALRGVHREERVNQADIIILSMV